MCKFSYSYCRFAGSYLLSACITLSCALSSKPRIVLLAQNDKGNKDSGARYTRWMPSGRFSLRHYCLSPDTSPSNQARCRWWSWQGFGSPL
ncbi:hypothetical protein BDZ97DRAFT_1857320 [Flammula alnicola]|nr:hypothetical protein BDZ97DRAFT_1857320 [Flammula alnicola]